ncbi:MAG TPA: hypothetical protein VFJ82_13055 [Longimicrobium sp.]|nr:hypothetical protein [Longimicrobium sp.]
MQLPALDDFKHQSGVPPALPWWVDVKDADFTLMIPDSWPDGDDDFGEPHQPSYSLALRVLPELEPLTRQAVEYLRRIVDRAKVSIDGPPVLNEVTCDARNERVTLRMFWEADVYSLWSVHFFWRDHDDGSPRWVSPNGMEYRSR